MHYDPETGAFTRLKARRKYEVGKPAGSRLPDGRLEISIRSRRYYANRLAWLYMTGEWPAGEVDHRDRDTRNDRWDNLREATHQQNIFNMTAVSTNSTGHRGVYKRRSRFVAKIVISKRQCYLGTFDTAEEASEAWQAASLKLHGEFSASAMPVAQSPAPM